MEVRIDEPRQDSPTARVDARVGADLDRAVADFANPSMFDGQEAGLQELSEVRIEQPAIVNDGECHDRTERVWTACAPAR
jgi:hypothetical protein